MTRPGFQVADAADVARPGDLGSLRLGLARMEWVKALPPAVRHPTLDAVAAALLPAIAFARVGAPPMPPTSRKAAGRQRAPGGGRRPNVTGHILASNVERALQAAGVPSGRWRVEGRSSPLLEVLALCWRIVTGEPGKPGAALRDMRRMTIKRNGWRPLPTRPMTAADRRWLWGLIS